MKKALSATLMLLGALCVLLLAGGFPLMGAESVYRGGAMLLAGGLSLALAAWGAWSLAAGARARLIIGAVFLFFAVAGVAVLRRFGLMACDFASQGGVMWWAALAMCCTALVGCIFTGVFGYLVTRLYTPRLWLAAAHLWLAVLLLGVAADVAWEVKSPLVLPADGQTEVHELVTEQGEILPLKFALTVKDFAVEPDDVGGVKAYRATCHIVTDHKGRREEYDRTLAVNEPLECKGWLISLDSYRTLGGVTHVMMQARRAPGRIAFRSGAAGIVICLAAWCWRRKEEEHDKETPAC